MNILSRKSLATAVGWVVVIYLAGLLAKTIKHNHDLKLQIDKLTLETQSLEEDKVDLANKIEYYQTATFQEREARAKLGLKMPGEEVIILPKRAETANDTESQKSVEAKSNWQQWMEFLFGNS